jgi:Divergent InlB B-repeat domain/PASTA domain
MGPRAKVAGLVGCCLALVVGAVPGAAASSRPDVPVTTQASGGHSYIGPAMRHDNHGHWSARVCAPPVRNVADCNALVVTNSNGTPLASASPPAGSYGPSEFHTGYDLPTTTPVGAAQQTIAIVDAYDDPNIESDLATYDSQYGLPACTTANGCFRKVNQNGGTSYPSANGGWAQEISLDVEVAHAICQGCKILLVEASSSSISDLGTAENTAASLGANVISNSYSAADFSGESAYDGYYDHPGVAITASSGDGDYGAQYPATSPYVTAVGGTTLNLNGDASYGSESVWNWGSGTGTGSGCSGYESKPSWQTDPTCTKRMEADVSADADPNTGAAVYDSYSYQGQSGWFQIGGTSLSAPLIAGVYALTGAPQAAGQTGARSIWTHASLLHDVTTGNNGTCTVSYYCTARTGYDGPTGNGTPNGLAAFTADFAPTATPSTQTVTRGGSTTYTVSLVQTSFPDNVTLSATGLPTGTTATFSPTSISGNATSTVTVTTSPTTPTGNHTLTIKGTSGALTHSTTVALTVDGTGSYTLSVSRSGSGSGSVTSSPSGISCGATCSAGFADGTVVTLTASPAAGSSFAGWSGACTNGSGSCTVTMDQARSVSATFDPIPSYSLTVSKSGSGSGTVTSSPAGISCGSTCSYAYESGKSVTLTASPVTGSTFAGWSGACTNSTGTCTVTMSQARSVTASFGLIPETLSVSRSGNGSGTVGSSPAGISCGSACSHSYAYRTAVTLTATAQTGSSFAGWSGACSGSGSCTVKLDQARSVTATFSRILETLTVAKKGHGRGKVTSLPAGISCGKTCGHSYDYGSVVTVTAKAGKRSVFAGWSGACTGKAPCTLSLSAARFVRASFRRVCLVPKVKGKRLRVAQRSIKARGCRVGKIRHVFSATVKKGHVISQKPRPHRRRKYYARLELVVSKGRKH